MKHSSVYDVIIGKLIKSMDDTWHPRVPESRAPQDLHDARNKPCIVFEGEKKKRKEKKEGKGTRLIHPTAQRRVSQITRYKQLYTAYQGIVHAVTGR